MRILGVAVLTGACRRFRHESGGAAAILTALMMFVLVGVAALAADTAAFYVAKRKLQGATDLAAIAAASDTSNGAAAAATTLAANGFPGSLVTFQTGAYNADPTLPVSQRFVSGTVAPNAAKVQSQIAVPMIFGRIFGLSSASAATSPDVTGGVLIGAQATAAKADIASFAIGSRLVALDGGIANAVLGALTGSSVSLSVVDYDALVSTNIDMLAYARALATNLNIHAVTYNDVLQAQIAPNNALSVLGGMSGIGNGTNAAVTSLQNAFGTAAGSVSLGQLVDFGPYDTKPIAMMPAATINMTAYEIASGFAEISNGEHQAVANLGATVPGLAGVTISLLVGSRPVGAAVQVVGSGAQPMISTVQIRAQIGVSVTAAGLPTLDMPIILDLARGTAQAVSLSCQSGEVSSAALALDVTPAVADLYVGTAASMPAPPSLMPPLQPSPLATIAGITLYASAHASMTNLQPTLVSFTYPDVAAGTVRTTSTTDPLATLTGSLLGGLQISTTGGSSTGVGSLLGDVTNTGLTQAAGTALQGAFKPIDQLLTNVTRALGLGVGQADTWVTGIRCGSAVVVN